VILVLQFYVPHPASDWLLEESNRWVRIIFNCALLLGVASLLGYHGKKIKRVQAGYGYSWIVYVSFALMVSFGLWKGIDAPRNLQQTVIVPKELVLTGGEFETELELYPDDTIKFEGHDDWVGLSEPLQGFIRGKKGDGLIRTIEPDHPQKFNDRGKLVLIYPPTEQANSTSLTVQIQGEWVAGYWMFQYMKVPMEATIGSFLAFFICSAAFRAFRARSLDATIMLVAALLIMIGRVSYGDLISRWISETWLFFPEITKWLMNVPATAARRAIFLGIAISVIATSIRIIFGIERSWLGRGD